MYRVFGSGSRGLNVQAHCGGFSNSYHGQNYWSGKALKALVRYTVSLGDHGALDTWPPLLPWPPSPPSQAKGRWLESELVIASENCHLTRVAGQARLRFLEGGRVEGVSPDRMGQHC